MWRQSHVDFFLFQGHLASYHWRVSANTSPPLGGALQSGCPQHRKFISGYAEGRDTLYKHDSLGGKCPAALSQHLSKESAVVLRDPFLLMLYIDTLTCVYLQMMTK